MMPVWPPAVDLLARAIECVRPYLDRSLPICLRVYAFWAGLRAARDRAAADVIEQEFLQLARDTGLTDDLGRTGKEDIAHLVRWGLLDRNPFR
jgi:hypothetical protein